MTSTVSESSFKIKDYSSDIQRWFDGEHVIEQLEMNLTVASEDASVSPAYIIPAPYPVSPTSMVVDFIRHTACFDPNTGECTTFTMHLSGDGYSKIKNSRSLLTRRRGFMGRAWSNGITAVADHPEIPDFVKELVGVHSPHSYAGFIEDTKTFLVSGNREFITIPEAIAQAKADLEAGR